MEAGGEPFTFAQKQVIDIQTAFVEGFKIPLALGKDNVRLIKQSPCLFADAGKPGAAYIAAVSNDPGDLVKPRLLGVFHSGVVDYRVSAHDHSDGEQGILFFKDFYSDLVKDNLSAVVRQIDQGGSFF